MYSTDINTSSIESYILKNSDSYIHAEYLEDEIKYPLDKSIVNRLDNPMYHPILIKTIIKLPNLEWVQNEDSEKNLKLTIDDTINIKYNYKEHKYFFPEIGFVWYSLCKNDINNKVSANIVYYDDMLTSYKSIENMYKGIEALIIGLDIIENDKIIDEEELDEDEVEDDNYSMSKNLDDEYISFDEYEYEYEDDDENVDDKEYYEDKY
jgi:hypothetical protein